MPEFSVFGGGLFGSVRLSRVFELQVVSKPESSDLQMKHQIFPNTLQESSTNLVVYYLEEVKKTVKKLLKI